MPLIRGFGHDHQGEPHRPALSGSGLGITKELNTHPDTLCEETKGRVVSSSAAINPAVRNVTEPAIGLKAWKQKKERRAVE